MVEHQNGAFQGGSSEKDSKPGVRGRIWILVDHSAREAAFEGVSVQLAERNIEAQIVTITEVIGSMAREAIVGGAERLLRGLRVAVQGRSADEDLIGAVRRARPDVLVITNARHVRALGLLESLTGIPVLQLGVLPDYNLSAAWIHSGLHAFVVGHEEQKQRLIQSGVIAERILVAGPAIQPGFARVIDRDAVREELKLTDKFVVLVRAEGFDAAVLEKLVFQCSLVDRPTRFIFHHNGDNTTAGALRRAAEQHRMPSSMFGKVHDLERYVAAADAVILSPQDSSVAELVASRRPLLFVGEDEQYAAQIQFLLQHEVAQQVANVVRLGSELDRFSQDKNLAAMSKAADEIASPDANSRVAEALSTALANLETWRIAPQTEAPAGPEKHAPQPEEPAVPSPFEDIGAPAGNSAGRTASPAGTEQSTYRAPSTGGTTSSSSANRSSEKPARDYSSISKSEATDQLAQLILDERDLERRLAEAVRQQERWRNRLELAREWQEAELAEDAEAVLRGYIAEAAPLERELHDILRQKEKLKQAAGGSTSRGGSAQSGTGAGASENDRRASEIERRFSRMEVDSDLEGLKDRIKREFGE